MGNGYCHFFVVEERFCWSFFPNHSCKTS